MLLLNLNLAFYFPIIAFEGFCCFILGSLKIVNSLFSTIEAEDHRYIGHGMLRYQLKSIKLKPRQQKIMRKKGITMVIIGLLLVSLPVALVMIHNNFYNTF